MKHGTPWCKSVLKTGTDSLFSTMRTDWLTNSAPWDDADKACANFDVLMTDIVDTLYPQTLTVRLTMPVKVVQ